MKLWLDELSEPPTLEWTWVRTVEEAMDLMETGAVTHASLDSDLSTDMSAGRKLVSWMAERDLWPTEELAIHAANPVAVEQMAGIVARYGPFDREGASARFRRWVDEA